MLKKKILIAAILSTYSIIGFAQFNNSLPVTLALKGAWNTEPTPGMTNADFIPVLPNRTALAFDTVSVPGVALPFVSSTTINALATNGLHDTSYYNTFSPGAELWFGLFRTPCWLINAVAFGNFMSGPYSQARGTTTTQTTNFNPPLRVGTIASSGVTVPPISSQTTVVTNDIVKTQSNRVNFGVGVNGIYNINRWWFTEAMLGGGITRFGAKAEFIEKIITTTFTNTTAFNTGGSTLTPPQTSTAATIGGASDHPGAALYRPFVQAEVGLGRNLTQQTRAYVFVNGAWTVTNDKLTLTSSSTAAAPASFVTIQVPDHWYQVGLAVTYDFV